MTTYEKIKRLCGSQGFAITTLPKHIPDLNISGQAISMWKHRSQPSAANLKKIADYFGVSVESLESDDTPVINYVNVSPPIPLPKMHRLPVYGIVSAGLGQFADGDIIGYEDAPVQYSREDYYYLEAEGDSMEPKIHDGDLLLVEKTPSIDSGQIGIVLIDGEEGVVKKVVYDSTSVSLISFNKEKYPARLFRNEDINRLRIQGRVILATTKL